MIISRTPFRISFFGGGTDYPVWFEEHGGQVLSCSIDKYCHISARWLPPFFDYKHRIVWSRIENVNHTSEIIHPSVRACLKHLHIEDGLEVHHNGDLPARAGLGSSSAFTVGMLHALYGLAGQMRSKQQLATDAIHIEQQVLGEAVGIQDQTAVAHGGFNHVEIRQDGRCLIHPVILPAQRLQLFQSHLMLFFTGISRFSHEIAQAQIEQMHRRTCELGQMYQMVNQAISILNSQQPLSDFGGLMHESWMLKRSLTNRISNPDIDRLYETARNTGAYGGKLLGAGGGGFMLLFADPENHEAIRQKLSHVLEIPFKMEFDGSRIIYCRHEPHTL